MSKTTIGIFTRPSRGLYYPIKANKLGYKYFHGSSNMPGARLLQANA